MGNWKAKLRGTCGAEEPNAPQEREEKCMSGRLYLPTCLLSKQTHRPGYPPR